MSKSGTGLGKPLKGISTSSSSSTSAIETSIISQISSGAVDLSNVQITGGTINSTVIGNDVIGPVYATILQTGKPDGTGYDVYFYGDTLGEYFHWNAAMGLTEIKGALSVSQTTDLGNIRISGNTISTTNTNGNINLSPNGSGSLIVNSSINQNTSNGNITFQTTNGFYSTTVSKDISLTSTTGGLTSTTSNSQSLTSNNGSIILNSGANKTTYTITNISTGTIPQITTSTINNLKVGDSLYFTGTNSVPNINNTYSVTSIVDPTNFTISPGFNVSGIGNTGNFTKNTDIYLTANGNINIPYDVKLTYGISSNYSEVTSSPLDEMTIASKADINITPGSGYNVNIPENSSITLGSDLKNIYGDNTNLNISSDNGINLNSTTTTLSGNLVVNGSVTTINSTQVSLKDPIVTLGGNTAPTSDDNKDRGVEFRYHTGVSSKLGYFGYDDTDGYFMYVPDAVNTGEVISGALGNAKFNIGNFNTVNIANGGSISAGQIDVCNLNCSGLMTLSAVSGININIPSGTNFTIPQGSYLRFGSSSSPSTVIYKEFNGIDLVIQSQGHVFLTPGSTAYDVIIPTNVDLLFNGEGGSQKIVSNTNTELTVNSSSFLNLTQVSGGVRLTEGLPLIFNQAETTNLIGDSMGNLLVDSGNNINLNPNSGQVTLPIGKILEFGNPSDYIGSTTLHNLVLNSAGTIASTSTGNTSLTTVSGNISLSPGGASNNVIIPQNKYIILGNAGEYIGTDASHNVNIASSNIINSTSTGNQNITSSSGSISLIPSTFVNIPYTKPLQFGGSSENITGTSGNLQLNSSTSTISGNLIVNGAVTTINSTSVTLDDPILTLGGDTIPVSDDNKDRGVEFRYHTGVSPKLGYFGYDDTDSYFMYVPDAVNTGEVISGALGNVKFATGSFTSLNMNNGAINAVNSVSSNTNLTLHPGTASDLIFNVDSGSNVIIPPNVDLLFDGEQAKFYSDGVDLHVNVVTPGRFLIDTNTVVNGDLTVNGNINFTGGVTTNFTVERFSVAGSGSHSPNGSTNISFINITGTGIATGTMPTGATDGFIKNICMSSIASGASYQLNFPSGRLVDAVSGTTVAKNLIFDTSGQSVQMVWDNIASVYIITQGGADVLPA